MVTAEKLEAIADALDILEGFAREVMAAFPDKDWSGFPLDLDSDEAQKELREWAKLLRLSK